jgi:glycosyltransferase involved in cell wall biosynthesis
LKLLLDQSAKRKQMAEKAKERFDERFSATQIVEQYQKLYEAGTNP